MIKFFQYNPNVLAVMSGKRDGNMKINFDGKKSTNSNRKKYFKKNGISEKSVVGGLLHHGNKVAVINNRKELFIPKTDALVTSRKGIYLSVTNADCYPVFFFDPVGEVVGIAHAGWKGVVSDILPKVVREMEGLGSIRKNIRVVIGPGICHDCFEFGLTDAIDKFGKYYKDRYLPTITKSKVCVSLIGIMFDQLMKSGVQYGKIRISEECTYCNEGKFFSARRDAKGDTNKAIDSMVSIIGMKAA